MGMLTAEQVAFYNSEGYLIIEDFASYDECKQMILCMAKLLQEFDPTHVSIFSTRNRSHAKDEYFYESANNISFFFEEKAFDEEGQLKQAKELSINKVGHGRCSMVLICEMQREIPFVLTPLHVSNCQTKTISALHEQDPVFREFSQSSKVVDVLKSLNMRKPVLIQSMYIFKQPGIGGEVGPHQDSTFLYSDPPSLVGFWLALEDATKENGCLWALPKSHKGGLARRYMNDSTGVHFIGGRPEYNLSEFVPLEVKAGSLILLHGALVHQSFENVSSKSRHAYSIHAFDSAISSWAPENWLQRREFPQPLFAV